jgi:uncharacterized repeat protein (TIGR03837 family)
MLLSCDLFCRVVDNLGDAGVCWRLARQLASEHGWRMRLWIDDLTPLRGLQPGIDPAQDDQTADGVRILNWSSDFPDAKPGEVVIEAFACELPSRFVAAMAAKATPPVWVNLEYLSAEDWVNGCHGLASPHQSLPLTKHFFFPGFSAGTGGLIREKDLPHPEPCAIGDGLAVSMFCYRNPALPTLLDVWADGAESIVCQVADGLPRRQVEEWAGIGFPVGSTINRGMLRLIAAPFVSQPNYDARLAACDLNFVRGEDSFVRAQWAERAFLWHIYPQDEDAHFIKLDAFLRLFGQKLPDDETRNALTDFLHAWNGRGDIATAWPAYRGVLPQLTFHARYWSDEIAKHGDLARNLVRFCVERL